MPHHSRRPPRRHADDDRRRPAPRASDYRDTESDPGRSNYWSPELEAVARRTMKQASGYAWMYEKMVAGAKTWGSFLSILAGVLAGVVGTQGLVSIFTSGGETPLWAGIVTAVIGYAIAVVVVVDNTWNLDVVRSEGLVAQVGFAHLSRGVMYQLALRPSERQDARDFVKGILNEIETMKLSSPTIDGKVKAAYIEKFKDNPIYNPEEQWEDYRYQFRRGWDDSEDDRDVDGDYSDEYWSSDADEAGDDGRDLPEYLARALGDGGGFDRTGVWQSADDAHPPIAMAHMDTSAADSPTPPADLAPEPGTTAAPPASPKQQRRKKASSPRKDKHARRDSQGSGDRQPLSQATLENMLAAYEDACVQPDV